MAADPRFSLVVPMHDEEASVEPLLEEVERALSPHGPFEVLVVDDKSTDGTLARLRAFKERAGAGWLRVVALTRRTGQSGAVMAGVERARGRLIATMDGDLQNDPADLPALLELVESGEWDGATGVRARRMDSFVRRVSSRIGNGVRDLITGDRVQDAACGVRVLPRDLFLRLPRFDGMHRFMPTLARQAGARIKEVPVNHRPRRFGAAKYGVGNRALRGLRDCLSVRWLGRRALRYEVAEEC